MSVERVSVCLVGHIQPSCISHGREHGKSGGGRLVVAGGKADESGDEDGGKRRESEEFFHKAGLLKKV